MSKSQSYEAQFSKWLDPFKTMLASKKQFLSTEEWLGLVERTKNSVILNPQQYLGTDLPEEEVITLTVTNIFNDFLQKESDKEEGHGQ